jgi:hypothetical protein
MKTYQEVFLYYSYDTDEEFLAAMQAFALEMDGWKYLKAQSEKYATMAGKPSCALLLEENPCHPAVAITKEKDGLFYVANIVPKETGHISMFEYNRIATQFAASVRKFVRNKGALIKVSVSKENLELQDIIPGKKVRAFFERYLKLHPLSYHTLDIEQLDFFICAASRYSRKAIDPELIQAYLMEKLEWSRKDAEWCANRIQIGFDVLKTNRKL